MTSIKVAYQSTVRRFTVPDTITWLELESKLRELFSLSPSFKFSLSYTDDEGDVITLSTDLELQEFLSQSFQSTLKFTITPEKQQPFVVETFSSNTSENGFVSIEKEKLIPDNVSEKTDKDDVIMGSADEPSFKPTIPSTSKGKQKEKLQEQEERQEQQHSPDNDEQQAPFIELAKQFQGLLDQFKDVLLNNPQLVEQTNTVMDQILRNIPVDINQWAQMLNTFRPEGDTNAQEGETNRSRDQPQHQHGGFGQFPSFFPPPHDLLSNPWIQRIIQDVSANCPGGLGNFENFARFNGCQQRQQQEELSQEALKEKINLLHSMGFWEDDVKNEELLKRYNGNIERVVEILVRQQVERNNNNSYEAYNSTEGVVGNQ